MIEGQLIQLQNDIAALAAGNPYTSFVPVITQRKLVIESMADEALAGWKVRVDGKIGLLTMVLMPTLRVVTPNVPGPQFQISVVIRTLEDPTVNNTGYTAEDIAIANIRWLDGYVFSPLTTLHGEEQGDALAPSFDHPGFLAYESRLVGSLAQDFVGRTAGVEIGGSPAGVTLACSDPAALIYYTVDGSHPMPPANEAEQNATAPNTWTGMLYTAPFPAPVGARIRAIAWNKPQMPSSLAEGVVES